ncbi:hypothetical protein GP486_005739, partial [Trichoglossum hirsutum]
YANPNAKPPTPIPTPTSATGPDFSSALFSPDSPGVPEFGSQAKWESSHHQEYLKAFFQSPHQLQSFQQPLAPSPDSSHRPSSPASHKRHLSDPEIPSVGLVPSVFLRSEISKPSDPPVDPANPSFSPLPSPTKRSRRLTPTRFGTYVDADRTVNPARFIRTPPPSRTMNERTARRKESKARLWTSDGVPGDAQGRKKNSLPDTNPLGYGPLGREPKGLHQAFQNPQDPSQALDMYGYPLSAPASVPAVSHKLFWDPNPEMNGAGVSFAAAGEDGLVDQNARAPDQSMDWGLGGQNTRPLGDQPGAATFPFLSDNRLSRGLAPNSEGFSGSTEFEYSQVPLTHTSPDSYTYMPAISDGAVNPNLIFSFSTESRPSYRVEQSGPEFTDIQPYHHQTQELERERGFENARKSRQQRPMNAHGRGSSGPSIASSERTRTRSSKGSVNESAMNSLNRARMPGQSSVSGTYGPTNDENVAPERRRSSPSKRAGQQTTLSSIPEKKYSQPRTTISFTIDDNGRAKAEAKLVVEESEWETETGIEAGYDEDDTESDTSTDSDIPDIASRKSSFTFPIGRSGRPKLARFATAPPSRSNESSSARTLPPSGSTTENRSLQSPSKFSPRVPSPPQGAPLFTSKPSKGNGHTTPFRRQSGSSFGSSRLQGTNLFAPQSLQDKEAASDAETVLEADEEHDNGTAQHAIRQLIKRKQQKQVEEAASHPPPNKKALRASQVFSSSSKILRHQETSPRRLNDIYGDALNISPTTVTDPDIATPSTDRGSRDNGETRCVCNSVDFEGLMILW